MDDPRLQLALLRYQAISPYIAERPRRGQRAAVLGRLANHVWTLPDGSQRQFSAETLRAWIRRYRLGGLDALMDTPRARPGTALDEAVLAKAVALKNEVPDRTLDTLIELLELSQTVEPGAVKRATLHRALQALGLSRRPATEDREDLDRVEAAFSNALWQSDMLQGPMIPDPENPDKMRRAWLYAFLDDHSRLLLDGRFAFKGDLPALELVLRRSLQKWGIPRKLYYDNGAVYRSVHMKRIAAMLGMHGIVFTKAYRPMGHGKIEAFNRYCKRRFIAEVKASRVSTLDELNEAFRAFARRYNDRKHGETGQPPLERWKANSEHVRFPDEEQLRQAFLFADTRKADKSGLFSLHTVKFQVGATLANQRVEVRYDPEELDEVEIWTDAAFVQRLRPFQVSPHRRPKSRSTATPQTAANAPETDGEGFDLLGHWIDADRDNVPEEPDPRAWKQSQRNQRDANTEALVEVLREHLDAEALDEPAVRIWLAEHGPFEEAAFTAALLRGLETLPHDMHPTIHLDALKEAIR